MRIKLQASPSSTLAILPFLALSFSANAKPWLDTGDMKLRHELLLLSDAGMLNAPLTTWPLSSKDIYSNLKQTTTASPELLAVLGNINERLTEEDYGSSFQLKAEGRSKELLIRDFSGEGREKASVSYDGQWSSPVVDLRLKATVADKSKHPSDSALRFDESYIAGSLSNWKFTVGKQSRWWGPSWDGSLILSNNARPIPSLSLENINSDTFDNKYLSWLGPNKFHMFIGQLESDRHIPNAKLIGSRFTFKPLKSLEVGLHRTIQWGGKGGDESISALFKTILGLNENSPTDLLVGNSIAGGDIRWNFPVGSNGTNYSLYGQYIGEDRAIGSTIFLGDETILLGGSMSGFSTKLDGSWRTYIEATDTSAAWFKGRDRNNIIYNHGKYTDGYRHLGVSMAHGIDSDSRMVSTGVILSQKNGDFWRGWIKHAKLNIDGKGKNPIADNGKKWSAIGISLNRNLNKEMNLNLGVQFISEKETDRRRDNDLAISISFTRDF